MTSVPATTAPTTAAPRPSGRPPVRRARGALLARRGAAGVDRRGASSLRTEELRRVGAPTGVLADDSDRQVTAGSGAVRGLRAAPPGDGATCGLRAGRTVGRGAGDCGAGGRAAAGWVAGGWSADGWSADGWGADGWGAGTGAGRGAGGRPCRGGGAGWPGGGPGTWACRDGGPPYVGGGTNGGGAR
ncbi:hypothetical protein GCM10023199_59960 [Actinomycetospora chibensis]